MHKSQSLFYLTPALHVSGVTINHPQEDKTVTTASGNHYTVLLSAAIVEESELVWVCCGLRCTDLWTLNLLVTSSFLLISSYNSPAPVSVKKWSRTGARSETVHCNSLHKTDLLAPDRQVCGIPPEDYDNTLYLPCTPSRTPLSCTFTTKFFNPLNPELNPICHLLALLGAHHILHVSRIRVN